MRLARWLRPGQRWRRRADGTVWIVRQVYRLDCLVLLVEEGGRARTWPSFNLLRRDFVWIAEVERREAA